MASASGRQRLADMDSAAEITHPGVDTEDQSWSGPVEGGSDVQVTRAAGSAYRFNCNNASEECSPANAPFATDEDYVASNIMNDMLCAEEAQMSDPSATDGQYAAPPIMDNMSAEEARVPPARQVRRSPFLHEPSVVAVMAVMTTVNEKPTVRVIARFQTLVVFEDLYLYTFPEYMEKNKLNINSWALLVFLDGVSPLREDPSNFAACSFKMIAKGKYYKCGPARIAADGSLFQGVDALLTRALKEHGGISVVAMRKESNEIRNEIWFKSIVDILKKSLHDTAEEKVRNLMHVNESQERKNNQKDIEMHTVLYYWIVELKKKMPARMFEEEDVQGMYEWRLERARELCEAEDRDGAARVVQEAAAELLKWLTPARVVHEAVAELKKLMKSAEAINRAPAHDEEDEDDFAVDSTRPSKHVQKVERVLVPIWSCHTSAKLLLAAVLTEAMPLRYEE